MREPPADLAPDSLRVALERDYGLAISSVTFLPLGHDSLAWVYQAEAGDGAAYFVKVRTALVSHAGLLLPHHLNAAGVADVVAPIAASDGRLSVESSGYVVIVYPFVVGETGLHGGMTDQQWIQFGDTLRKVHETEVAPDVDAVLQRESFEPEGRTMIRRLDTHVESQAPDDDLAQTLTERWLERRATIIELLETAEVLGERLRHTQPPLVVCHADAHTNNVIVDPDGRVRVVDWDGVVLAPRERDLMFVIGGIGVDFVSPSEEAAFMRGYGPVAVDPLALAYYRFAWAVSDIASYGEQVLLRPDLGRADRVEGVERFDSLFRPGEIVDIALGSPI